jgi:hypothetical protein
MVGQVMRNKDILKFNQPTWLHNFEVDNYLFIYLFSSTTDKITQYKTIIKTNKNCLDELHDKAYSAYSQHFAS